MVAASLIAVLFPPKRRPGWASPRPSAAFLVDLGVLGLGILAYTAFFTFLGYVPQAGHHPGSDLRLRLGERHPVFPGIDAEVFRRPLPEIASAVPPSDRRRREGSGAASLPTGAYAAPSGGPGPGRDQPRPSWPWPAGFSGRKNTCTRTSPRPRPAYFFSSAEASFLMLMRSPAFDWASLPSLSMISWDRLMARRV